MQPFVIPVALKVHDYLEVKINNPDFLEIACKKYYISIQPVHIQPNTEYWVVFRLNIQLNYLLIK